MNKTDKFEKSNFSYGEIVLESVSGNEYTVFDIKKRKGDLGDIIVLLDDGNRVKELNENEIEKYTGKIEATLSLKGDTYSAFYTPLPLDLDNKRKSQTHNKRFWSHTFVGTQDEFDAFLEENFKSDYPLKIKGIYIKTIREC